MELKKNLAIILMSISSTLLLVAVILLIVNNNTFSFNNNSSNKKTEKENTSNVTEIKEIKETKENTSINEQVNNSESTNYVNTNINPKESNNTTQNENSNTSDNIEEVINSEEKLVSYLEDQESLFDSSKRSDKTLTEKLKTSFVSIVDFIFYDKEIKGYKFKNLTNSAKLRLISLALRIDNKIDTYFPDYKESIKDKYTSIKGKLAVKYLEYTASLCESVGPDTCKEAKENFSSMKDSFGLTWDLVKELALSGSNKIKEFYESWKEE